MSDLATLGERLAAARARKSAAMVLMGAHVLRAGVQRQLIDLMERGLLTHIGMNGAGPIHDYELARIGATCESVARYIRTGEFGLWRETAEINDVSAKEQPRGNDSAHSPHARTSASRAEKEGIEAPGNGHPVKHENEEHFLQRRSTGCQSIQPRSNSS